jgi:hypothetical protein
MNGARPSCVLMLVVALAVVCRDARAQTQAESIPAISCLGLEVGEHFPNYARNDFQSFGVFLLHDRGVNREGDDPHWRVRGDVSLGYQYASLSASLRYRPLPFIDLGVGMSIKTLADPDENPGAHHRTTRVDPDFGTFLYPYVGISFNAWGIFAGFELQRQISPYHFRMSQSTYPTVEITGDPLVSQIFRAGIRL